MDDSNVSVQLECLYVEEKPQDIHEKWTNCTRTLIAEKDQFHDFKTYTSTNLKHSKNQELLNSEKATKEKHHLCALCSKSFTRADHLKQQVKIHTAEKKYSCSTCNESFRQIGTLRKGKKFHSGERPFTCETCNKSFVQSNDL